MRGEGRPEALLVLGGLGGGSLDGCYLVYASAEDGGQLGRIGETSALEGRKVHAVLLEVGIREDTNQNRGLGGSSLGLLRFFPVQGPEDADARLAGADDQVLAVRAAGAEDLDYG